MPAVAGTGFQHTLSDLREHIYACLMQDESASHFKPARVDRFINQVFDKMRLKGLYSISTNEFTTIADQQTWVPESNVWRIVGITYDFGGSEVALEQISRQDMDALTDADWDANSGDPRYWVNDGEYIWFSTKMPTGKRVKYWYWERAQELTTDDELSGFYKIFLPVIVAGVMAQAKLADAKLNEHQLYKAEFNELAMDALAYMATLHAAVPRVIDHYGWSDSD